MLASVLCLYEFTMSRVSVEKSIIAPQFLVHRGKIKGSIGILFQVNLVRNSPRKQYPSFILVTLKYSCLPGKLETHIKFVHFFCCCCFCLHDRRNSRHFLQSWSLAPSQNSRMLNTLFGSECVGII